MIGGVKSFAYKKILSKSNINSNNKSFTLTDSIENYSEVYVQIHVYVSSGTYNRGCYATIPVSAIKDYGYSENNQYVLNAVASPNVSSSQLTYLLYAQIAFTENNKIKVVHREATGWSGTYYITVYAR